MENPATWGPAEKIIEQVLHDHAKLPRGTCGLSVNRKIADALREAGLLKEEE